ncbi:MAG: ABC transporter ATP-binding protein [Bdellovibrionota bacterium]
MSSAIKVADLTKSFKENFWEKPKQVLKGVSFQVHESQTCGFVGNNGSGKTTTLKCILQFIFPDEGEALFFGEPLNEKTKMKIGYLTERPYFYEFLTAKEYLKFHWELSGGKAHFNDRAAAVLKQVDLTHATDKRLRSFSKGMLQRMGLAQALLHEPHLLILDEPMSGLDPDGRLIVKEILRDLKSKQVGIFFSSHLLEDMEQLCDELVVVHQGKIIFNESLTRFMAQFESLEKAFKNFKAGL